MNKDKIYDYLKLMRIPGVFTAQADIITGFILTSEHFQHIGSLALLLISSSLIYTAGMVLNDYFDYYIDKKERPKRPLPSGRIKRKTALIIGILFLAGGICAAFFVNIFSFIISIVLTCFVLAYNIKHKKNSLLCLLGIGGCRYLNLLLGFCIIPLSGSAFLIPVLTGSFTCSISILSKNEVKSENISTAVFFSTGIIAVVFLLYCFIYNLNILPNKTGMILCLIWTIFCGIYILKLIYRSSPDEIQKTVKTMIFLLVILDGIIVAGMHSVFCSFIVWAMLIPAVLISKKIAVT